MSARNLGRAIVLGHNGFIGSHIVRALQTSRTDVQLVASDLPDVDLTSTDQAAELTEVFDRDAVVVMCSGVKRQLGDSLDSFTQNVLMVTNVCRVLEQRPVGRFVYLSSTAVYGEETTNIAISESTPVHPTSTYGIAKFASERLLRTTAEQGSAASLVVLRPPLTYGPGDQALYGPSGFVHSAAREAKIGLWGEGDELREFLFVEDLAAIVARLAFIDHDGVLNVVAGRSRTFCEAAEIARELVPETIVHSRPRSRDKADHAFDGELLRSLVPDLELTSLEAGMRRTLAAAAPVLRETR